MLTFFLISATSPSFSCVRSLSDAPALALWLLLRVPTCAQCCCCGDPLCFFMFLVCASPLSFVSA